MPEFAEELRETTKDLREDSRCCDRDSKRTPPEYKSEAMSLARVHLVKASSATYTSSCLFEVTARVARPSELEGVSSSHIEVRVAQLVVVPYEVI
jgi:hypothetical protein